jgi:adenosylcobinamide kinase / adenosylcobinamide-phosphate guanylyltransferase
MSRSRFALVGGGARSGKSAFALRLARRRGIRRLFGATAVAFDDEMRARISAHAKERGGDFSTLEAPNDLDAVMARLAADNGAADVVVIDCATIWLSNVLLAGEAPNAIELRVERLASTLHAAPFQTLLVTNEVGMGLVPETPLGRAFRDLAGRANQSLARVAGEVYFAALGTVIRLRPGPVELADDTGEV